VGRRAHVAARAYQGGTTASRRREQDGPTGRRSSHKWATGVGRAGRRDAGRDRSAHRRTSQAAPRRKVQPRTEGKETAGAQAASGSRARARMRTGWMQPISPRRLTKKRDGAARRPQGCGHRGQQARWSMVLESSRRGGRHRLSAVEPGRGISRTRARCTTARYACWPADRQQFDLEELAANSRDKRYEWHAGVSPNELGGRHRITPQRGRNQITGCRGHPCRRKYETTVGFIQSSSVLPHGAEREVRRSRCAPHSPSF